jgi:glycosyltransferase involved in cell wall biosynthesis
MYYRKAGISNYTRRLVQAQALALAEQRASDVALHILLDRRDTDTFWVPEGVTIIRTATPAHHQFEHIALPLELSRFAFHVLHSPDFIACPGRFRKVITIHDLYFMEHPEVMGADGRRYYSRVRRSARMTDRIITPSRFTRDDVLRLLPDVNPEYVHVVHEAADAVSDAPSALLLDASPYILFVGTLEPRKNLVTLLRALSRLPNDVRLTVVGAEGWAGTGPGELARELGVSERVTLAGRVSDAELDALYRGARVFAMPSLSEGFGLPVLEAMARGTPVVCSDSGSLPEIAGDAALLHEPLDDATLAQHLLSLWRDDAMRAHYAHRGLARAAQFSWQQAAAETLDVYRAALGSSDQ